jgi:hypothetical protein
MTRNSKTEKPAPPPLFCEHCHEAKQTILAEWQRAAGVMITVQDPLTKKTSTKVSEGSWERRYLCDACAAKAIVSLDPPRRLNRTVPDRLVQVLNGPPQKMVGMGERE